MTSTKFKKLILDATAFISLDFPKLLDLESVTFYTTLTVTSELKDFRSKMNLEILLQKGNLEIHTPDIKLRDTVKEEIKKIDPHTRLSVNDIDILVLALQMRGALITNDFAVQNIAIHLKIPVNVINGKKISKVRQWVLQCKSCGKILDKEHSHCPDCSGRLKRVSIEALQRKTTNLK